MTTSTYDETKEEDSNTVKAMKNDKERESSIFKDKYRRLELLVTETRDDELEMFSIIGF